MQLLLVILIVAMANPKDRVLHEEVSLNICFKNVYAPPLGKWGQEVQLVSCFGEDVKCKFSIVEKTGDIIVRYQTKSGEEDWKEYREGTFIKGQVISVRAVSTSITGVGTTIKVECSCDCQ